jgi:hypothetical protein
MAQISKRSRRASLPPPMRARPSVLLHPSLATRIYPGGVYACMRLVTLIFARASVLRVPAPHAQSPRSTSMQAMRSPRNCFRAKRLPTGSAIKFCIARCISLSFWGSCGNDFKKNGNDVWLLLLLFMIMSPLMGSCG